MLTIPNQVQQQFEVHQEQISNYLVCIVFIIYGNQQI